MCTLTRGVEHHSQRISYAIVIVMIDTLNICGGHRHWGERARDATELSCVRLMPSVSY